MKITLPKLKCKKCSHIFTPRTRLDNPKCNWCKSTDLEIIKQQ